MRKSTLGNLCIAGIAIAFSIISYSTAYSQCDNGTISGYVYNDTGYDGNRDSGDTGIPSIYVRAYTATGSLAGQSISNGDGSYTVTGLIDGLDYTVTFDLATDQIVSVSGSDNGTDVQHVRVPYCNASLGIIESDNNCSASTEVLLSCFVNTLGGDDNQETVIGIAHNFDGSTSMRVYANQAQTGSVWGLAYAQSQDALFSASFIKQNSALASGGHDAIYKTTLGNSPSTVLFTKLSALGQTVGSLSVSNPSDCNYGRQVGKIGLGAMDIDDANDKLFVVNLHNKTVVSFSANNPSPATTRSFQIPNPGCSSGDSRPFALKYHNGMVYVGVTCTAETSGDDVQTSMHIYSMNPLTGAFSLEFSTTYGGGHWNDTPAWKQRSQWLTDLAFTDDGNIVLGISDRLGHRYCDGTTSRVDDQHGEILKVGNVNGVWVLEKNGKVDGQSGSGVANNDGPGGGEFFGQDFFPANSIDHPNTALGSIVIVPGTNSVIASVFDPLFNTYSGGLHRYSTIDGSKLASQELYNRNLTEYFGKATGFGDIVSRCGSIPAQIGNYVWNDINCDGIQNADEPGIANLRLHLYDSDCNLINTTTTDPSGYYAFDSGIASGASYSVALANDIYDTNTQAYVIGGDYYFPTVDNGNTLLNSKLGNSSICFDSPSADFITRPGNNTTIDIGLKSSSDFDLALIKVATNATNVKVGDIIDFTIQVYNQGGITADNYEVVDYLSPAFIFDPSINPGWVQNGNRIKLLVNENLAPGQSHNHTIRLAIRQTSNSEDYINSAEISNTTDTNGVINSDSDSTSDDDWTNDNGGQVNTPTDDQIDDDGTIDEDDEDPAEVCVLDLALVNVARNDRTYNVGDLVTFDITVHNQGTIATTSFDLASNYPSTLDFVAADNPGWVSLSNDIVTMQHSGILLPGATKTYAVHYRLNSTYNQDEVVVFAEISNFTSSKPGITEDFDSTPDAIFGNDNGGEVNTPTDNQIDDDGTTDEDDEDPASISPYKLDLALMITTEREYVEIGETVDFRIELYNQGDVTVSSVMVMNYVPEGFSIMGNDWTIEATDPSNQMYYRTLEFPNGFAPGDIYYSTISLGVLEGAQPGYQVDYAEIGEVRDLGGNDVSNLDIDSKADKDMTNDAGGIFRTATDNVIDGDGTDDEDDQDPVAVYLATIDITDPCTCKNNATNAFDGQYDEEVIVTAPSGQNWYLDFVFDIFDPSSANPPAAPTPYILGAMGYQLIEAPIGGGVSEYILNGILVESIPYSVRVTNGEGAFLQISGGGSSCVYIDPVIESDGLSAVCGGSSFTYCIDPIADCTSYSWTLSGGGVISGGTTGTCITVDWGAATGGPFDLVVTPTCTDICVAPGVASINVGSSTGPMSCRSEINVSLDDNCRTQLTPAQFLSSPMMTGVVYQLMVTDHHGNPVPNGILTEDHLWTSLMVKVINPCDGNSCWSTIKVEDKLGPVIQCDSITMPCYELDAYIPLVADNCSTSSFELIRETTKPLHCDPDFIKEVERTYIAIDGYGNKSPECNQTIKLERIPIDSIDYPDSLLLDNNTNLICHDSIFDVDGRVRLDLAGVPSLFGRPLIPAGDYYCNFYIDYDDFVITTSGCVTKIMRTFTAYEDWCSANDVIRTIQIIEITDNEKPVVVCPPNITISTDGTPGCDQEVLLPLPTATDNCSETFTFDISTEDGFFPNVTTSPTVTLTNGVNMVRYNVYDECGNIETCTMSVRILDEVPPVAVCDRSTTVSLRSNGTAKAFAHTFDDGSYDDCKLFKFLTKRINSNCDCNRPVFDDMTYLGERNGRLYYLSNYKTNAFRAFDYSTAFGGMILREESCDEHDWVYDRVTEANAGATYYTGITDASHQGRFTFTNHVEPMCDAYASGQPLDIGDNVIVDENGEWVVVNGGLVETFFVVELSDPCGFSDEVHFCCADANNSDHMVVFRAIDKEGRFNDCMVNVKVQDKVAPTITCPADRDIDCDSSFDLNNLSQFGEAVAVDSCAFTIAETAIDSSNACGQGMIFRIFTATDGGGSSSCTQEVTLVNPNVFDLSSVTLPMDYFTDLGCNSGDLQPENLPDGFGLPTYDEEACSMIGITFRDQTFTFSGPDADACLKILRTYTIIDWCQSDDPGYTPIVYNQTIKVSNTIGPEILSGCDDMIVTTDDCDFGDVSFTVISTDDCTEDDRIAVSFELQLSDGTTFSDSNGSNVYTFNGKLPIGEHIAFTSFSDLCGNVTTCAKKIVVVNTKVPTAACIDGLSIGLVPMDLDNDGIPDNEMACIFPEMIDASSTHICGIPIKLSFSSDTSDVKKVFDCTDKGNNEVELWVTLCIPGSDTLIQSFCTTTVEVQDNNDVDFCPRFDLALRKTISDNSVAPYQPGDVVTFDVEVFNQGNVSAFNIELIDYIPTGLTLNDSDWTDLGNGSATLVTPIPFLEDSTSTVVPITFIINQNAQGISVTNIAEITAADNDNDPNNEPLEDEDSNPDNDPGNDVQVDDEIDNGNNDEDDQDPAVLKISVFDLALTKVINIASSPGPYNPGDDVSFILTLFNQGNVDATDVVISDYIPEGFTLNQSLSPGFIFVANNLQTTVSNLAAGTTMSVGLTLTIDPNYTGNCLINSAEITSATNADGIVDQDDPISNTNDGSNPELGSDNDIADDSNGGMDNPNDEDDYDPAKVDIVCNLAPICNSVPTLNVTLGNSGTVSITVGQIDNGSAPRCDGSMITTSIDINSFDCSDVGSGNTVTLTILDSNGQTSTCQTEVTVIDEENPTIACQNILTTLDADGMIVLDGFVIVTASDDNCAVVDTMIDLSNINLSTIDCEPQDATATVSDQFGNTATCTFQIAIENAPPIARCSDFALILDANGNAILVPQNIDAGSDDDCTDNLTLSLNQTQFDCDDIVGNTVVLTVTDASGLTSSCFASVSVADQTPPTALCDNATIQVGANGAASITAAMIDNGSSDQCVDITLSLDQTQFDCGDKGNNTVTLTVTDGSDNTATCNATVTVEDIIAPEVMCLPDFTVQLLTNSLTLSPIHFISSAIDNCAVIDTSATPTTFVCADKENPVAVLVTVTDACNNTDQCTVNVTVEDNVDPTCTLQTGLTFPPNITIEVEDVFDMFSDNCATVSSSSTITPSTFSCMQLGMQTVTVEVNDDCGNSSTCATTVNIVDMDMPVCVANDISVCLDPAGQYTLTAADRMAITNGSVAGCDDMFVLTFSQMTFDCDDAVIGATPVPLVVTLTTSDNREFTCNSTVTVEDKEAPVVVCADDFTLNLDAMGITTILPSMIIESSNDNCPITQAIDIAQLTCNNKAAETTVTATVTDRSGNSTSCTTNVAVEDKMAPTCALTTGLEFPPNVTISVEDVFDTFSDNCATVSSASTIDPTSFTCMDLGTQLVTVTVNDDCGNSGTCSVNVEIVDMDMPVCVANDISVCLDNTGQYTLNQTDIDNITNGSAAGCDDMFTLDIDITQFLCNDISTPVCVTVTLTSNMSTITCQSKVTVIDKIDPTVSCVADFTLDLDADGEVTLTPSMIIDMADDNCSFTQAIDVTLLDCTDKPTATLVTATVTDQAGNTATCTTNVSVEDNMDPTCTLTTGLSFPPNVMIEVADVLATFTDNCATVSSSSTIAPSIFSCSELGPQMVTVTVNDDCGNSGTCSVEISIEDSSVPIAVCQDITVSLGSNGTVIVEGGQVDGGSSSACGSTFTFSLMPNNFDCGDLGMNAVVLTVTSTGGTSATCTATVTIVDDMPPTIVCPADMTLPCDSDVSDTSMFGDATASDNCDMNVDITLDEDIDINVCSVGTITRTFTTADDNSNVASCEQIITISSPVNPIDDGDIIAPPTPITFNECFDPNNIVTEGPIVDTSDADCFNLSVSFSDSPQSNSFNCSGQFTRTWSVVDSCQAPLFIRNYDQIITLDDNTGPMITGPVDITIQLDPNSNDCDTLLSLPAMVTDCVGGFTVFNNSPFADDMNSGDASGTYPLGSTTVTIIATDVCGSVSTYSYTVTVVDQTAFIKTCDKIIATITPSMTVDINTSETNADICTDCPLDAYTLSWSDTDPNVPIFTADCSFVGNLPTYTVYLWSGNFLLDSCSNLLQVLDGGGFCMAPLVGDIVGQLRTYDGVTIEGASVDLMGSPMEANMTEEDGRYAFSDMPFGGAYDVIPSKDGDYLNGISTADIIAIQRHILGEDLLDSPYKVIAADVNHSEDISTLDLIEIRKLILGINNEFENNTSWRMVDSEHQFLDALNPFTGIIPEDYLIYNFDQPMVVDFVGVKVGDVNNSVIANAQQELVEKRDLSAFDLEVDENNNSVGATEKITFSSEQLDDIDGLQMTILFDTEKVDLVGFIPHASDLNSNHINTEMMLQGVFNMSWNKTQKSESKELFSLIVQYKENAWTSDVMKVSTENYIIAEAYQANVVQDVRLRFENNMIEAQDFHVYQNLPNPWTENTTIKYYIPQDDGVILNVYDVNSRLILTKEMQASEGINEIVLSRAELKDSGLMYYEIVTPNNRKISKMILIR